MIAERIRLRRKPAEDTVVFLSCCIAARQLKQDTEVIACQKAKASSISVERQILFNS